MIVFIEFTVCYWSFWQFRCKRFTFDSHHPISIFPCYHPSFPNPLVSSRANPSAPKISRFQYSNQNSYELKIESPLSTWSMIWFGCGDSCLFSHQWLLIIINFPIKSIIFDKTLLWLPCTSLCFDRVFPCFHVIKALWSWHPWHPSARTTPTTRRTRRLRGGGGGGEGGDDGDDPVPATPGTVKKGSKRRKTAGFWLDSDWILMGIDGTMMGIDRIMIIDGLYRIWYIYIYVYMYTCISYIYIHFGRHFGFGNANYHTFLPQKCFAGNSPAFGWTSCEINEIQTTSQHHSNRRNWD